MVCVDDYDTEEKYLIVSRIQECRKKSGIKASDMANELGICVDQYSKIENGRSECKIKYLRVIAQILNVSTDFLLYGKTQNQERQELQELLDSLEPNDYRKAINAIKAFFEL